MDITISLTGGIVHVTWDCDSLSENITRLFAPWQVRNTVHNPSLQFEITVTSSEQGYLISSPKFSPYICTNELIMVSTLEYYITLLALDIMNCHTLFHSAVIDCSGKGAMLAGGHGSGKTTLALTAISSGLRALSDEVGVVIENCTEAIGFPRPFRVLSDIQNMVPTVIPHNSTMVRITDEFCHVYFDEYYAHETSLAYIFFPVFRPGNTVIRKLGETEALNRILTLIFNFSPEQNSHFDEIIRLIRNIPLYEIAFGNNWDAVHKIRDMLEEHP